MSSPRHADEPSSLVDVTADVLRAWALPDLDGDADKRSRGLVVVVGGTRWTPGAVILAGIAALRAGAGKLRLVVPASVAPVVAGAVPEALVAGAPETAAGALGASAADVVVDLAGRASCVLVGPGTRDAEPTAGLVDELRRRVDAPLALDARAASSLPSTARADDPPLVLTPNLVEAAPLAGVAADELERDGAGWARRLAARLDATVSLRGATTWTAAPGAPVHVDRAGCVGLATSGSGDVLAGLLAGLVARSADPLQAAVWAAHVHGLAGERLAARIAPVGFLARELLDEAPHVLAELERP